MDIKYIDKTKYLLDNYKALGMTEIQVILLLVCIENVNYKVDYEKLLNCMGINPTSANELLIDLVNKNLVKIELVKNNDSFDECLDISNLFVDRVNVSNTNVYGELEFIYGKTFNKSEMDLITKWVNVNLYTVDEIKAAINVALLNNVRNLKYVEKILENSNENIEESVAPFEFEYDWLKND